MGLSDVDSSSLWLSHRVCCPFDVESSSGPNFVLLLSRHSGPWPLGFRIVSPIFVPLLAAQVHLRIGDVLVLSSGELCGDIPLA